MPRKIFVGQGGGAFGSGRWFPRWGIESPRWGILEAGGTKGRLTVSQGDVTIKDREGLTGVGEFPRGASGGERLDGGGAQRAASTRDRTPRVFLIERKKGP